MKEHGMKRPTDLADFATPPLHEVVLGVQFEPIHGYQQIFAKDIWELFSADHPKVMEQPLLPPTFETFGTNVATGPQIKITSGASHDRFWFISEDEHLLIQFQQDRLLQNWRKLKDESHDYPRFEKILESFEKNLRKLDHYYNTKFNAPVKINQCEISYINHIHYIPKSDATPQNWIKLVSLPDDPDTDTDFKCAYRKVILNKNNEPIGRLIVEAATALDEDGKAMLLYNLTVKGVPDLISIESAIEFLVAGRHMIVETFDESTTEKAHKIWGKDYAC